MLSQQKARCQHRCGVSGAQLIDAEYRDYPFDQVAVILNGPKTIVKFFGWPKGS